MDTCQKHFTIFNLLHINTAEEKVTEEEIKSMIDEGTENGEVQEVEQDIVDRVFSLGDHRRQHHHEPIAATSYPLT